MTHADTGTTTTDATTTDAASADPTPVAPRPFHAEGYGGLPLVGDEWGDPGNERPPVLLLHGGGQNRHAWRATAARLAAGGYFAVTVDARGHGDSGWSPTAEYDMEHYAADVLALLERFDRPPVAVGASMGGMSALLAQAEVGADPQLFRAVVLVDVTPRMELTGVQRIMGFMTANPDGFATLQDAADAIAAYNPHRTRQPGANLEGLRKVLRERNGRYHWRWDPAFVTSKAEFLNAAPAEAEARMAEMAERMHAAALVRAPALLVRGSQSDLVSGASVRDFLRTVPHARFVDVAGAGHMVAGDDNDTFSVAVLDFLAELA
ncbi:MAG: alpha/beta hydrolase [Acidimicrobiales bacterium]